MVVHFLFPLIVLIAILVYNFLVYFPLLCFLLLFPMALMRLLAFSFLFRLDWSKGLVNINHEVDTKLPLWLIGRWIYVNSRWPGEQTVCRTIFWTPNQVKFCFLELSWVGPSWSWCSCMFCTHVLSYTFFDRVIEYVILFYHTCVAIFSTLCFAVQLFV